MADEETPPRVRASQWRCLRAAHVRSPQANTSASLSPPVLGAGRETGIGGPTVCRSIRRAGGADTTPGRPIFADRS